jgi:predicted Zn-dependent peptidase
VVNVALGGSFTSRLNQNLRERHGYTYGASSQLSTEDGQTTFLADASVETEVTGAALAELRQELNALASGGLREAEVRKAAEIARHELVERIQTSEGLAEVLAEQVIEGHPPDALRRETLALGLVGVAQADAEARQGPYGWDGLTVVLVGDRVKLLPQLTLAGFPTPEDWDKEALPTGARATPP